MWFIKKILNALRYKVLRKYAKDPLENIIGIARSGIKDGSVNHDQYLYGSNCEDKGFIKNARSKKMLSGNFINPLKRFVYSFVIVLSLSPLLYAQEIILKNGELFEVIKGGSPPIKLTNTKRKVAEFFLSPHKRYIAYSKIVRYIDEPGIWADEEKVPQRPVYHVVIFDLKTKMILAEILPQSKTDPLIYMDGWVSDGEILLHDADGFAVSAYYSYDLNKKELIGIEWEEYEKKKTKLIAIASNNEYSEYHQ